MAENKVQWLFKVIDQMSRPMSEISETFATMERRVSGVTRALQISGSMLDHWLNIATRIGSVIKGIAEAGFDMGNFALEALSFKENTLAGMEILLGGEQAAQRMFQQMVKFGAKTPFSTKDTIDTFRALLGAGFNEQEVPIVFQGLSDISSMRGFDMQSMEMMTRALGQIRGLGTMGMHGLKELITWSGPAGVGMPDVLAQIAKQMHITNEEASAMMEGGGGVTSSVGIVAFLEAVRSKLGGVDQKLGSMTMKQSTTFTGLMSTMKSIPSDLFLNMDLSKMSGFQAVKGAVENVIKLIDPSASEGPGARIRERFAGLFNSVFGGLFEQFSGDAGLANMDRMVDKLVRAFDVLQAAGRGVMQFIIGAFEHAVPGANGLFERLSDPTNATALKELEDTFHNAGMAIGDCISQLMKLINLLTAPVRMWEGWSNFITKPQQMLGNAGNDKELNDVRTSLGMKGNGETDADIAYNRMLLAGTFAAKGMKDGISAGSGDAAMAANDMSLGVFDEAKKGINAHSPSLKFQQLGEWAAEGYQLGLDSRELTLDAPRVGGIKGRGGMTGNTFNFQVDVHGAGDGAGELAERIAEEAFHKFTSALESAAIEEGA